MKERINNYINNFYRLINNVGFPNFMLIIFIFGVILITGLYSTFSLSTVYDGMEVVDGLEMHKFILKENYLTSVSIAANSYKNIDLTITSASSLDTKYGLYYSTNSDLTGVVVGSLVNSESPATGLIDANSLIIVTVKIVNDSNNDVIVDFGIAKGLEDAGELILPDNCYWGESVDNYLKIFNDKYETTYFHNESYRNNIKNIAFVNYIDTSESVTSWDMSIYNTGEIMAWVTNNEIDGYYDLYIGSNEPIKATSLAYYFSNMGNIDSIDFSNLDTSITTNMSMMFWYTGCYSTVFTLDLGDNFDTSNVRDFSYMFSYTGNESPVFTLDLGSKFDTSSVTDMSLMFYILGYNNSAFTLSLGTKFSTDKVTDMEGMFYQTGYTNNGLTLDLIAFTFDNVTTYTNMFYNFKTTQKVYVKKY